jgi:hypothetical protein
MPVLIGAFVHASRSGSFRGERDVADAVEAACSRREITMRLQRRLLLPAALAAITAVGVAAFAPPPTEMEGAPGAAKKKPPSVQLELSPSQQALADCIPGGDVDVTVKLTTDTVGVDSFTIKATNLPPNRDYTVFLLQTAGPPFGAAEYIGDVSTNKAGNGTNTFHLIVQEAFASTNGANRVDLNRVGMWFADPADDDFCTAATGVNASTPFDGDGEAGVQVFNSANAPALPPP